MPETSRFPESSQIYWPKAHILVFPTSLFLPRMPYSGCIWFGRSTDLEPELEENAEEVYSSSTSEALGNVLIVHMLHYATYKALCACTYAHEVWYGFIRAVLWLLLVIVWVPAWLRYNLYVYITSSKLWSHLNVMGLRKVFCGWARGFVWYSVSSKVVKSLQCSANFGVCEFYCNWV